MPPVDLSMGQTHALKQKGGSRGAQMWIETVWRDLRYAIRILGRNPGFGAVAVLSLALGIGANVAAFTLINALLLRELPVPHPEQLVDIGAKRANGHVPFSYPMFRELARGQRVFSEMLAWSQSVFSVEVDGELSQNAACAVDRQLLL